MKRAEFPFPKIPQDPDDARIYHKSASKRGTRIGKNIARMLAKAGFKGGRILDVGCGSGEVLIEVAKALTETELVGLDLSGPLLDIARSSAAREGLTDRLAFRMGDAEAMPFDDDSFNFVLSVNTFHVIDDPVAMLNEIERVLKPDGGLAISCIRRSWLGWFMRILKTSYTSAEAKEILSRSKLRPWKFQENPLWFVIMVES